MKSAIQPGDGIQPLEFEVKLVPQIQKRVDLVVAVDKAIQRRDAMAAKNLKRKLSRQRHGHLLIKRIDEEL